MVFCEVASVGSWAERLTALLIYPQALLSAYPAVGSFEQKLGLAIVLAVIDAVWAIW